MPASFEHAGRIHVKTHTAGPALRVGSAPASRGIAGHQGPQGIGVQGIGVQGIGVQGIGRASGSDRFRIFQGIGVQGIRVRPI